MREVEKVKLPQLSSDISRVSAILSRGDVSPEEVSDVVAEANNLHAAYKTDPLYFAEHASKDDVAEIVAIANLTTRYGYTPEQVVAERRYVAKRREDNTLFKVDREESANAVGDMLDDMDQKDVAQDAVLRTMLRERYEHHMAIGGDADDAETRAVVDVQRDSTEVGKHFIPGGRILEDTAQNHNVSEYWEGLINNEAVRAKFARKGIPTGADLNDTKTTTLTADPDGWSMTLTHRPKDGLPVLLTVPMPRSSADILPTPQQIRADEVGKALLRTRMQVEEFGEAGPGGSFHIPEAPQ